MTPQRRYERVKELYQQAVELDLPQRAAFLEGRCGGDAELVSEVRSLLEQEGTPTGALVDLVAEAARAADVMRPMIDRLFDDGLDPAEIARRARADGTLSDLQRRAALNLVLRRSMDLRDQDARGGSHPD